MCLRLVGILLLVIIELFKVDASFECNQQLVPCGCGLNDVEMDPHIAHGEYAVPYSWPMVVSLRYNCRRDGNAKTHCCTGTILAESYVLTSAQCVDGIDRSLIASGKVTIVAGIHNPVQEHRTFRTVDGVFIHPNWTKISRGSRNDIAILHVTEPFDFATNMLIARTCRPPRPNSLTDSMQYPAYGTFLAVVGWGQIKTLGSAVSQMLQQTRVYSVHHKHPICMASIKDAELQFCAELREAGTNPNNIDSDSPVLQWIGDRWEQVGIVSDRAVGYSTDDYQYVFTRVASYYDWIKFIMSASNPRTALSVKTSLLTSSVSRRIPTLYRCNRKTVSCGCGLSQVELSSSRIIGGEEAIAFSWPMMTSLRFNGSSQHACGGSILNDFFILTAAHCVDKLPRTSPTGVTIAAAFHKQSNTGQLIIEVDQIYVHPKWNGSSDTYTHDIAILHLSEPLVIATDPFLKRTCVPQPNGTMNLLQYPPNGTRLAVIGWGIMQGGAQNFSDALQQAEVFAIDNEHPKCKVLITDKETQFCAGLYNGDKDSCQGDSGGPILEWKGYWWEQVGITSYRSNCGISGQPSIYTRLAYYFDWMEEVMNESLTLTTRTPPITNPPLTYTCNKTITCGCGSTDVVLPPSRIIGGYNTVPHSWPMIVSFRTLGSDQNFCAGTILSESFILTAAHCVVDRLARSFFIAAGIHKQSQLSQILRDVDRVYVHPEWVYGQLGNWNDIAILHLSQPLNLSTNSLLSRTCLPPVNSSANMRHYPLNGTRLAAIGWGAIEDGYNYAPDDLQQTEIFVIDKGNQFCDKTIKDKARQFCAGLYEGGKGTCRGDSGGPVLEWKGNRWEQVGITSYGISCADPDTPGVYTQVFNYIDWIEKVINEPLTITTRPPGDNTCHLLSSLFLLLICTCFSFA